MNSFEKDILNCDNVQSYRSIKYQFIEIVIINEKIKRILELWHYEYKIYKYNIINNIKKIYKYEYKIYIFTS